MKKQGQVINVDTSRGETTKYIVYGVLGVVALTFAYFGIVKPVLNAVGLTKDREDRAGDKSERKLSRQQVLSPQLYKSNMSRVTIGSSTASEYARNIYDAKGIIYDNEDKAVGSITGAGSKVNISFIADRFQKQYGRSMSSYLYSFLEPKDWIEIDNYIDTIKKF